MLYKSLGLSFLALVGSSIASAEKPDTRVAEVLCRGEGFTPHTLSFGDCVRGWVAKFEPKSIPTEPVDDSRSSEMVDHDAAADDDFGRAIKAYNLERSIEAYEYMLKAARAGDRRAFTLLARFYMDGSGVSADPKKGLFWLKKAEQSRDPEAYPLLARAYLDGQGVPQDIQKAFSFVEVARNAGAESQSQEIERILKQRVGDDAITCAGYGVALGTPENGQCRLQLQQARQLAEQQAQLARQQELFAQQQARFAQQQYELQAQQYQRQLAADRLAREAQERAESRAASESLYQFAEDLLCPKQGSGPFAPPVAGCGSNKHVPRPPTVNVIVNTEARDCRYRTAAGCH